MALVAGVRWSFRDKDAGSVRSDLLRARLRTLLSGRAARPGGTAGISLNPPNPDWPVAAIRFARPTDRLPDVLRFYEEGLGLRRIDSFEGHEGYSGVMLGLPGSEVHLELTTHEEGSPGPAPTRDNLLVLYMTDRGAIASIEERLRALGHEPVEPENPYWSGDLTFEDPDGWRLVVRYVDP